MAGWKKSAMVLLLGGVLLFSFGAFGVQAAVMVAPGTVISWGVPVVSAVPLVVPAVQTVPVTVGYYYAPYVSYAAPCYAFPAVAAPAMVPYPYPYSVVVVAK